MAPCNKRLPICLLLLLVPILAGCSSLTLVVYNRGSVSSPLTQDSADTTSSQSTQMEGGGELIVEPSKP
jgi:hypothetical protein